MSKYNTLKVLFNNLAQLGMVWSGRAAENAAALCLWLMAEE